MPTHDESERFLREWKKLEPDLQRRFRAAVAHFVQDLPSGQFRPGLRVKPYRGNDKIFEITFAPNGRALWEYRDDVHPGDRHVRWLRIGTHDIFRDQ